MRREGRKGMEQTVRVQRRYVLEGTSRTEREKGRREGMVKRRKKWNARRTTIWVRKRLRMRWKGKKRRETRWNVKGRKYEKNAYEEK